MTSIRWTQEDYAAALRKLDTAPDKPSKYRNKKTEVDGILFDSKKEAKRWIELKLMQQAGQITDLRLQHLFPLIVNGVTVGEYRADFTYMRLNYPHAGFHGLFTVEDVKGYRTDLYQF